MTREDVERLHSLGPVTAQRLADVGIGDAETLRKTGAAAAYRKLRFRFGKDVTLNALYGLDAAIRNFHWREIDAVAKPNSNGMPAFRPGTPLPHGQ